MIGLLSPLALALLVLVPALVGIRIWMSRRRRAGIRYSSLSLIHEAAPRGSRIRRHLPFALFALGVASLVLAAARPVAIVSVRPDRRP
jgi:Ca-activated chloride channel family protein